MFGLEGNFVEIERSYLVSVILPAYNAEKTIREAVDSVLSQTYDCFELIIIDDASTDGTKAIIEEFALKDPRIKIFYNEQNKGVLKTRIRGVQASFGKWIAFLDSDDIWSEDKLAKQVRLQQETASHLVYTGSRYIDKNGKQLSWVLHVPAEVTYKRLLRQNVISNSSVMIMKDIFLHYTPISEDHRDIHEDFACWLLLLKEGYKACGVDEPLVTYRISGDSMTGNKVHSAILNWYTYRFVGLNVFQAAFYMISYVVKGIIKYSHIRRKG